MTQSQPASGDAAALAEAAGWANRAAAWKASTDVGALFVVLAATAVATLAAPVPTTVPVLKRKEADSGSSPNRDWPVAYAAAPHKRRFRGLLHSTPEAHSDNPEGGVDLGKMLASCTRHPC
ncbi:hypothetical protein BX667DRAFT_514742 [Coemansia mojavensis]|nr:hypothetical protein BX667DRAFT_514742 [Coemansia mojavensis]